MSFGSPGHFVFPVNPVVQLLPSPTSVCITYVSSKYHIVSQPTLLLGNSGLCYCKRLCRTDVADQAATFTAEKLKVPKTTVPRQTTWSRLQTWVRPLVHTVQSDSLTKLDIFSVVGFCLKVIVVLHSRQNSNMQWWVIPASYMQRVWLLQVADWNQAATTSKNYTSSYHHLRLYPKVSQSPVLLLKCPTF